MARSKLFGASRNKQMGSRRDVLLEEVQADLDATGYIVVFTEDLKDIERASGESIPEWRYSPYSTADVRNVIKRLEKSGDVTIHKRFLPDAPEDLGAIAGAPIWFVAKTDRSPSWLSRSLHHAKVWGARNVLTLPRTQGL